MAKNRKAQSMTERFSPAIKAFLLCLMIGGAGVGYVWQKNQIHQLGREIKERETQLSDLQRQNKIRTDQLASLISPKALDARVKKLNLGLSQPPLSQIVRLIETRIEPGEPVVGSDPEQLLTQASR
ncbi:MAG: hypothetical protein H0X66_16210 [Verrucomicrobia bacterium]|nr:hypothetical protein [Verrucomicrobiota bacterium]